MLVNEDANKFQVSFDRLSYSVGLFGMHFAPPNCEMLSQDWVGLRPCLVLADGQLGEVGWFSYSSSCTSSGDRVSDEKFARIQKAQLAFVSFRHSEFRRDIQLSINGRAYTVAMRSVLPDGSETWSLWADVRIPLMFEHRCLRNISRIWWESFVNNSEVRCRVLDPRTQSFE